MSSARTPSQRAVSTRSPPFLPRTGARCSGAGEDRLDAARRRTPIGMQGDPEGIRSRSDGDQTGNKTGIKMVAVVQGPKTVSRIDDVRQLQLKPEWESVLGKIMYDNRIDWELWVEHAESYKDLRRKLSMRGITGIPPSFNFLMNEMASYKNPETVDAKNISKITVMTQRGNKNNQ